MATCRNSPFSEEQDAELGIANPYGILQHELGNGLQSPGDELITLKNLRCGRLLLQRLAQFVEQPRVLDGDDGLGGEVLN